MSIHTHVHNPVACVESAPSAPVSYRTALWSDLRANKTAPRHPLAALARAFRRLNRR